MKAVSSSQDTVGNTGAYSPFKRVRSKPPSAQRAQHKGGACQCFSGILSFRNENHRSALSFQTFSARELGYVSHEAQACVPLPVWVWQAPKCSWLSTVCVRDLRDWGLLRLPRRAQNKSSRVHLWISDYKLYNFKYPLFWFNLSI